MNMKTPGCRTGRSSTAEALEVHRKWTMRRSRVSTPSPEFVVRALASPPDAPDERYFHEDLPGLSDGELRLERCQLQQAILLFEPTSAWTVERLERLKAELEARHAR
jgi:hypothetical protein